jgi:hypothetical protein
MKHVLSMYRPPSAILAITSTPIYPCAAVMMLSRVTSSYTATTKVDPPACFYDRSPDVGDDAAAHASGLRECRALWTSGCAAVPT